MNDLPELIMDSTTYEMMHDQPKVEQPVVRVDGPLPTVTYNDGFHPDDIIRPLRVGDRVRLATQTHVELAPLGRGNWRKEQWVFATATVAKIIRPPAATGDGNYYLVTVTDVEALP